MSPLTEVVGYVYILGVVIHVIKLDVIYVCDPLSKNPALPSIIEFKLEAILSVQVVFRLRTVRFIAPMCYRRLPLYHTKL